MLLVSLLLGITYICHSDRLQHHPMRLKYKHTAQSFHAVHTNRHTLRLLPYSLWLALAHRLSSR